MLKDLDDDVPSRQIVWITCFELEGAWTFIPTERTLRAYTPESLLLQRVCSAWRVLDNDGVSLLKGGLQCGVFMVAADLRQLCAMLKIALPVKGSGKKGRVLKVDIARKLVMTVFPDGKPEDIRRMIGAVCFSQARPLSEDEENVTRCMAELAEEDRECHEFKKVAKLAQSTMKEKDRKRVEKETREKVVEEMKEAEAKAPQSEAAAAQESEAAAAAAAPNPHCADKAPAEAAPKAAAAGPRRPPQTPASLKDLLRSPVMQAAASLIRDPSSYGYKAIYPSWAFTWWVWASNLFRERGCHCFFRHFPAW